MRIEASAAGRHDTPRGRHPCGFTLVEVLLALTIGSLLVVSVVSATRALSTSREGVDHRCARSMEARRAMEVIVAALRNVRRDPIRGRPVIVGHSGGRSARRDAIDLLVAGDRRCRPEGPESDQHEISFYLAKQPGQPLPVLMCRRDHGLDDRPEDGGIATVVAEGIVGLSFEYYYDGLWSDEWSSAEPREPEAVRVTVAAVGPETGSRPSVPEPLVLSTLVRTRMNEPVDLRAFEQAPEQKPSGQQPGGTR